MTSAVLDASALLAFLRAEPGANVVSDSLAYPVMISAVNYAETVSKLIATGASPQAARRVLAIPEMTVVAFDRNLAEATGELFNATKSKGLSLGDRACLALAAREGLPVLTADRAWVDINLQIEVRLIR